MSTCNKIKFNYDKVCIGDLRHKIQLYARDIVAPNNSIGAVISTEFTENFTLIGNVWSAIKINQGKDIFDEVSLDKTTITHYFYIRYKENITQENWVTYKNNRYDIKKVSNMNARDTFLKLDCVISGNVDKAGSEL